MKKYNLIWIVVDGVRSYRSGSDDRDRIDIMDEFGKDSIEFTNAITSAPSSILSAATMFTGLPACYISRHFNDFIFDPDEIDSLQTIMKDKGYNIYSIFDAKACRTSLQVMAEALPQKYYPPSVTHDEWWPNREINNILEYLFRQKTAQAPAFFLLWYNCRKDPKTSFEVERALQIFKDNNMYDNSIIIMCSDHGFPDPNYGLTKENMKKFSHDMIVTDDNIRIPLFLKYPGGKTGIKIDNVVGTADLFPTVLELLGVDIKDREKINYQPAYRGESLLGLINGNKEWQKTVRVDTRLTSASGRTTALRSDRYKYSYYVDEDTESFHDLKTDPYEVVNLAGSEDEDTQRELQKFRALLKEMDDSVFNYHSGQLAGNLSRCIDKRFSPDEKSRTKRIVIASQAPVVVLETLINELRKNFKNSEVDFLIMEKLKSKYSGLKIDNSYLLKDLTVSEIRGSEVLKNNYDIIIFLTENSKFHFLDPQIIDMMKKIKGRKFYMMDYNFNIYSHLLSKWFAPFVRRYRRNKFYYKEEPLLLFKDLWSMLKSGVKINIVKDKKHKFNPEEIKIMRDEKALAFNGENPFIKDRSADQVKRDVLEQKKV